MSAQNELVFYTNPQSRGRITRWMLEEVEQPYRTEIIEYGSSLKSPAYLSVNPMGKVPALRHGDFVVTETAAICAYLADSFPAAKLAPEPGSSWRAPYYRWLFFAAGPLEAAVSNKALGVVVPEGRERMMGYGTGLEQVLDVVESQLMRHDYLAGDRFTAADLYLGSHLGFGMQFKTIEPRPAFEAYWQRLSARPAKKRAEEIDNSLIKKAI